tara:strand:- start:5759 stop:7561 length:1803 start_codon:yes stop_codon:yes gene_type:complete
LTFFSKLKNKSLSIDVKHEKDVALQISEIIFSSFISYMQSVQEISKKAGYHFASKEWAQNEINASERLKLHNIRVLEVVSKVQVSLDQVIDKREEWRNSRDIYQQLVARRPDQGLAETFFNSVARRVFTTIGIDNDVEIRWFGATTISRGESKAEVFSTWTRNGDSAALVDSVLSSYELNIKWEDRSRDAKLVAGRLDAFLMNSWGGLKMDGIDMLKPVFYRNRGAYLIGRVRFLNRVTPFILPILHGPNGLIVDTVLLTEDLGSRLFGFTRSYFFIDWPNPSEVVGFLKSLLPTKSLHQIYTALGYPQHGKSSLYRSLYRHLQTSNDKFVKARGTPGMVMSVFTLVSFNVVFKIIKDHFDPPKNTTRDAVRRRYDLVYSRDRVGRMVDTQEFENLSFDLDRFDPDLLSELLEDASESVFVDNGKVVIKHAYTERHVYPLNLYLQEMSQEKAEAAAIDWGYAIKDLAAANVWPGDLFTKNFGVTRHGNVVFYDYDELALLEECRFRNIPDSKDHEDEMRAQPWFAIQEGDAFPEQFETFMSFPKTVATEIWENFKELHDDLFTVEFWQSVQKQLADGDLPEFFPYPEDLRFRHDLSVYSV